MKLIVCYAFANAKNSGNGRIELNRFKDINGIEDIEEIENQIQEVRGYKSLTITNIIPLPIKIYQQESDELVYPPGTGE